MSNKHHKKKKNKVVLPRSTATKFLHSQSQSVSSPDSEKTWKLLPWLLLAAFALRAFVSLFGDFVVHPDEIMQYLEPAHHLVFGSGVVYWEYFYGARSWLVPGVVAAVLWLCKLIGLNSPVYYIAAVKLFFCLLSLLVPWGMYVFSRRHWGEQTARMALVLGVLWYELFGFAHKPFTEFIATSLLLSLLCFTPLADSINWRKYALAGALGALIVAVRFQYAPIVGFILLAGFWGGDNKLRASMVGGGVAMLAAVAVLEIAVWGAPFHSYYVNAKMNLIVGGGRTDESSILYMPGWLLLASGGLLLAALYGVVENFRRRGFVLLLLLLVLLPHMLQNHREYRFIFVAIPLWLLLFADYITLTAARYKKLIHLPKAALGFAALISLLGIFNLIPLQEKIYKGFSFEAGKTNFLRAQDPIFKIYRLLSEDDSVRGVLDFTRPYFNTGGYYYLGREVPFYDRYSWRDLVRVDAAKDDVAAHVSHIITDKETSEGEIINIKNSEGKIVPSLQTETGPTALPSFVYDAAADELVYWSTTGRRLPLTNYESAEKFGALKLWKIKTPAPVREWKNYEIMAAFGLESIMEQILGDAAPTPPPNYGVEFVESQK